MLAGNDMGGVAAVLSQKITGEQAVSCAAPGTLLRRFIPADAGNIMPAAMWTKLDAVHPRGCGEHST